MFDFVRDNTRWMFGIIVLLIIPSFVFFGIEGYTSMRGQDDVVAEAAGIKIKRQQWDAAHKEQSQRYLQQMPNMDAKLLDSPEAKARVLEGLVREQVLGSASEKLHLLTPDARLLRLFSTDPQLAGIRNPDGSLNQDLLKMQGMTSQMFEQRLRQDISKRQVMAPLVQSVPAATAPAEAALNAFFQQREVQVQTFELSAYLDKVNPTEADLQAYYKAPANAAQFQAAEQAEVEYLVLDLDAMLKQVTVSAAEVETFYKENLSRYSTPQERRASHILLKLDAKAAAQEVAKVQAKAQELLDQVKKNPERFAELARQHSEDEGSARQGGDLDFFARGAMVKPFEQEAFALKQGQISGLVRTDFGFHIIQVTGERGGEVKALDTVRAEIEDEVRRQSARKKYAEAAGEFTNLVYEQYGSLQPAAEKLKLEVRKAKQVTRQPLPGVTGPLAQPKFLEALFSADSIAQKRNTEAVELGPNQLVSGRLVQYTAARTRPFDEVKELVRASVVQAQAAELARKDGEARLAALKADKDGALDAAVDLVSRVQAKNLPRPVLDAVLGVAPGKLPGWLGVEVPGRGYAVAKVIKVVGRDPALADLEQGKRQYAQAWADAESQAYYALLKRRFKVKLLDSSALAVAAKAASEAR